MADDKSIPVMVRLSADQVAAVDQWRRAQKDIPSRPEAIRRLAEIGIGAALGKGPKAKG